MIIIIIIIIIIINKRNITRSITNWFSENNHFSGCHGSASCETKLMSREMSVTGEWILITDLYESAAVHYFATCYCWTRVESAAFICLISEMRVRLFITDKRRWVCNFLLLHMWDESAAFYNWISEIRLHLFTT